MFILDAKEWLNLGCRGSDSDFIGKEKRSRKGKVHKDSVFS